LFVIVVRFGNTLADLRTPLATVLIRIPEITAASRIGRAWMRVCYFIQSHRDQEQILRLTETLRSGSADGVIVLQHHAREFALDWDRFARLPDVRQFHARGRQLRSDYSCQVQPLLDVVDWLDAERIEYDWLVTLTAQDYPVKPIAELEALLERSGADGFLRWWDVLSGDSQWSRRKARARYFHRYWRLPDGSERMLHRLRFLTKVLPLHFYLVYGPWLGLRRLKTPFNDDLRCQGGWAWVSLRREAARYLNEFLRSRPDVEAHYRKTIAPEESLVQTVLVNARRFRLVNDDLRYIDYATADRGSPRTLGDNDFTMLADGPWYFARKFDHDSSRGLADRVDRELLSGLRMDLRHSRA
jgi:hypothetical protein